MTVDAGLFEPGGKLVERRSVSHFPAEEARAFAERAVDHDALLAVVHPEGEQRIAALDRLQAEEAGAELAPVVQRIRSETRHIPDPAMAIAAPPLLVVLGR